MDNKLELLLKKLNINEKDAPYFSGGSLDKIIANKTKTNYKFYITLKTNIPYELYEYMNNEIRKELKRDKTIFKRQRKSQDS